MKKQSRMYPKILVLIAIFVLFSCRNTIDVSETPKDYLSPTSVKIPFSTLLSDGHSNIMNATSTRITSRKQLRSIFNQINSTRKPGIPVPEIDFMQKEIFFYTPGEVTHGVGGLHVAQLFKRNDTLVLVLKPGENNLNGYATTVMSQPCVMISYNKLGLPVVVETANKVASGK